MSSNQILAASLFRPAWLCAAVTKTEGSFENLSWPQEKTMEKREASNNIKAWHIQLF